MENIDQPKILRTILTPDQNELILHLPNDFLGKSVEVIAFVVEPEDKNSKRTFSAVKLDTRNFTFDREMANER